MLENKIKNQILVSIVMPTYNTKEEYLRAAVESILNQTYSNFEFIIINDGSIQDDSKIIKSYKDKRIKLYENDRNSGITYTLNRGLVLAKGKYVLRMDSDDIACQDRIEKSVKYMEEHPNTLMAGGHVKYFGDNKKVQKMPLKNDEIRAQLLISCPFIHPTIIFNNEKLKECGFKYKEFRSAEDYLSWFELAKNHEIEFGNIDKILINYRIHSNQITNKKREEDREIVHFKMLSELGIDLNPEEKRAYCTFVLADVKNIDDNKAKLINKIMKNIILKSEYYICEPKKLINYYKIFSRKLCMKMLLKLDMKAFLRYYFLVKDI